MKKRASRRSIVSVACLSRPNADVLRWHPLGWSGVSVRRPKGGAGKAEHEQHPILPSATVQPCNRALCRGASLACAIPERATEASPGRRYRPPVVDESQVAKERFAESRVVAPLPCGQDAASGRRATSRLASPQPAFGWSKYPMGRTSIPQPTASPRLAAGCVDAMRIASAASAASMRKKAPICSLVSA